MKNLLLLLLFIPFNCFAQELNDDGSITKVVNVEITADEIYSKINEWVAETYNSAEAVTKLNSKSKVITEGTNNVKLKYGKYNIEFKLKHTVSISIRDNKYKMDLAFGEVTSLGSGSVYDWSKFENEAITYGKKMTKGEYQEFLKTNLSNAYKGKKLEKQIKKVAVDGLDKIWGNYEYNCDSIDKMIKSFFNDIENKVSSSDDW